MSIEEERAQFEAWAKKSQELYDLARYEEDPDRYLSGPTRKAWEAWQAAIAATGKQHGGAVEDQLLDELRDVEDYFNDVEPNPIHLATVQAAISALATRQPRDQDAAVNAMAERLYCAESAATMEDAREWAALLLAEALPHLVAPTAQGIDLGQFRPAVKAYLFRQREFGSVAGIAEGERLLALIDQLDEAPKVDEAGPLKAAITEALGCFSAAESEGWLEALHDGDIERIRELWARRISYVLPALQEVEQKL